jgi:putative oxidoreductase
MTTQQQSLYAATVLRFTLGIAMLAHGMLKAFVFTMPGTVRFFVSQGFPGWLAYPVTAIDLLGGAAIIIGFHSRIAAVVALPVLLGAVSVHFGNGWLFTAQHGGWEYPAFLAASAVVVALLGDGVFAVSNIRRPQAFQKLRTA